RNLVAVLLIISTFITPVILLALLVFSRKSQIESVFNTASQMQPKFLAIGSEMDEPWQLLHYMRDAPNPMAVDKGPIRYLASSMKSHISEGHQVARIYGAKSYRDLKLKAKLFLAVTHLLFFLLFLFPALAAILITIYFVIAGIFRFGF